MACGQIVNISLFDVSEGIFCLKNCFQIFIFIQMNLKHVTGSVITLCISDWSWKVVKVSGQLIETSEMFEMLYCDFCSKRKYHVNLWNCDCHSMYVKTWASNICGCFLGSASKITKHELSNISSVHFITKLSDILVAMLKNFNLFITVLPDFISHLYAWIICSSKSIINIKGSVTSHSCLSLISFLSLLFHCASDIIEDTF